MGRASTHGYKNLAPGDFVSDFIAVGSLVLEEDVIVDTLKQICGEKHDESKLQEFKGFL